MCIVYRTADRGAKCGVGNEILFSAYCLSSPSGSTVSAVTSGCPAARR